MNTQINIFKKPSNNNVKEFITVILYIYIYIYSHYPLVISHNYGESPFFKGKLTNMAIFNSYFDTTRGYSAFPTPVPAFTQAFDPQQTQLSQTLLGAVDAPSRNIGNSGSKNGGIKQYVGGYSLA